MRARAAAVMLGVTILAAAATSAPAAPPDLPTLARAFDDGALRVADSRPETVTKWTRPLYYAVHNVAAQPSIARDVLTAVREIAAIAGLQVVEVAAGDGRANIVARFDDNEGPSGSQTCYAQWQRSNDGAIVRVELFINFRNWQRINRCIVHEALHGFGFQSHAHAADSVLSYVSGRSSLTETDRLLLQTLYDRRLVPGMAPVAASRTACRILGEKVGATPADIRSTCAARSGPRQNEAAVRSLWQRRSYPASP